MSDYEATVVRIENLKPVPGLDNLVLTNLLGYSVLVGKETRVGDIGLLFTAETQLSDDYACENNLYRDSSLNADPSKKGYLDANRRIRAVQFRGTPSNGLFMPLSSLDYTGWSGKAKVGESFSEVFGEHICNKYEPPKARDARAHGGKTPSTQGPTSFMRYVDTLNWFKSHHLVHDDELIFVTQKLHGTSIRIGNVKLDLPWYKRFGQWLGLPVKTHGPVVGSRNVVKDLKDENDLWVRVGKSVAESLPKDTIVFGEIVGWNGDKPIQQGYTYGLPKGECRLYIYNTLWGNGCHTHRFCPAGLKPVPGLALGTKSSLNVEDYLNRRFRDEGIGEDPLPLSDPKSVDEGVCLRVQDDSGKLRVFKAKSSKFLEWETRLLDRGLSDVESES